MTARLPRLLEALCEGLSLRLRVLLVWKESVPSKGLAGTALLRFDHEVERHGRRVPHDGRVEFEADGVVGDLLLQAAQFGCGCPFGSVASPGGAALTLMFFVMAFVKAE